MNKEDTVVFHTMELSRMIIIDMEKYFSTFDFNFNECRLIMAVHLNEPISQVELAKILQITPATLSTRLKRLEKLDYIKRDVDKQDSRKTNVMLTEKSNSYLKETKSKFFDLALRMQSELTNEEIEQYIPISKKIKNTIGGLRDE